MSTGDKLEMVDRSEVKQWRDPEYRREGAVAFAYGRVSTDEQADEGQSLGHQACNTEAYYKLKLKPRGVEWGGFHADQEGVSAFKVPLVRRRVFEDIMRQARAGDHLIVDKVDRIFRMMKDYCFTVEQLNRAGLTLHIVDMNGVSMESDTPMGDFMLHMMVAMAQMESQQTSKRTRQGMNRLFIVTPGWGFVRPDRTTDWVKQPDHAVGMPFICCPFEREIMGHLYSQYTSGVKLYKAAEASRELARTKYPSEWDKHWNWDWIHDKPYLIWREAYIQDAEEIIQEQGCTYQEAFEQIGGLYKKATSGTILLHDVEHLKAPRLKALAKPTIRKQKDGSWSKEREAKRQAKIEARKKALGL
jgi:hypothetical protein